MVDATKGWFRSDWLVCGVVALAVGCASADDPTPSNAAPRAVVQVVGSNTVLVGTEVVFDASESVDPDGDPVRIRWALTVPEASQVRLEGAVGPTQRITPDVPGAYQVTITVSDQREQTTATTVITASEPENLAPEADAGPNQSKNRGENVELDGSGSSDPDGDSLTYAWRFESIPAESAATLRNPGAIQPSFTADVNGTYIVELTVSDEDGLSNSDTVTIGVGTDNTPPTANAGENIKTAPNTTVTLSGSQSTDVDGDGLTYRWSINDQPTGESASLSGASSERAELTVGGEGAYVVELRVTDVAGASDVDTVTVTAETSNRAPRAVFSLPSEVYVGNTIVLDGSNSTDPDGDDLIYLWDVTEAPSTTSPANAAREITEVSVFFKGAYTVSLTVEDAGGLRDTRSLSFQGVEPPPGVTPTSPGELVITEFMANPEALVDAQGEWIELYNPSLTETYQLQDCVLTDDGSDLVTITELLAVAPGQYITLSNGSWPGFTPSAMYGAGMAIANSGDEIVLDCNGVEVDRVNYDSTFPVSEGKSTQLDPANLSHTANNAAANWCVGTFDFNGDLGTPGAANDPC